jgi:tetratricopeptide (TPR) repeat protein
LQNLAWISFQRGATRDAEERLHESADMFAELGDWGGLGWALGLLAYVRYMQGRLDEAAELAEQIAVEGGETGNRWAVGMMNVLLANVSLWRGHGEECLRRGRQALTLFRDINDPWGEVQAAAPTARALASLGRFNEYLQLLAELDAAAHRVADPGFVRIGPTVAAAVAAQMGDAERALDNIAVDTEDALMANTAGNVDRALSYGLALMQNGRVDDALSWLEPAYAAVEEDGPLAALGGLMTIAYAAADRPDEALRVADAAAQVQGGTYSDRMWRRWGEGFARLRLGDAENGIAALDDADAIAAGTDSKIDQAIASMARTVGLESIGHPHATAAREDTDQRLAELGITGQGWAAVFNAARPVGAPSA